MINWEEGLLSEAGSIILFSELIKSGLAWQLQGTYGREAVSYVENKIIDKKGNILVDVNSIF
jgi:hypothetical protein